MTEVKRPDGVYQSIGTNFRWIVKSNGNDLGNGFAVDIDEFCGLAMPAQVFAAMMNTQILAGGRHSTL